MLGIVDDSGSGTALALHREKVLSMEKPSVIFLPRLDFRLDVSVAGGGLSLSAGKFDDELD